MPIFLKFKASLDDSAFMAGIRRITTASGRMARGVGGAGRGVGRGGGAFLGLGGGALGAVGIGMGARAIMRDADAIYNLSRKTGMTTQSLAALAEMGKGANIEIEQLSSSVSVMQSNLAKGTPAVTKALADMNLSFEDLNGLRPEEKFAKIGAAIAQMVDQDEKASAARGLFGRGGTSMFELFDDIGKMDMNKVSGNAKRMGEAAKPIADAMDQLALAGVAAKSFGATFIKDVLSGDIFEKLKNAILQPQALLQAIGETPVVITGKEPWKGFQYANKMPSAGMKALMFNKAMGGFGEKDRMGISGSLGSNGGLFTERLTGGAHSRVSSGDRARAASRERLIQKEAKERQQQLELTEQIKKAIEAIEGIVKENFD